MHTNRCHPKMVFNVYKLLLPENVVHCVQIVVTRKWCSMCKNHCHLKTMLNVNKLLSPENSVQRVQMVVTRKEYSMCGNRHLKIVFIVYKLLSPSAPRAEMPTE